MKHLGNIVNIKGYGIAPVNVVIGGSPCQDLSTAGKRHGIHGERSGLFMEQIRIIKEMRDADANRGRKGKRIRPRFMVWENVPGAFVSNKGQDFGTVLQETARICAKEAPVVPVPEKGWPTAGCLYSMGDDGNAFTIAWRVFDAQFWGVPQRRRRIALVADFGGESAPEILFERKGMQGDIKPGKEEGQTPSCDVGKCTQWDDPVLGEPEGSGEPGKPRLQINNVYGIDCWNGAIGNAHPALRTKSGSTLSAVAIANQKCHEYVAGFNGWKSSSAGSVQYQEQSCPTIESTMPPNVVTGRKQTPDDMSPCSGKADRDTAGYALQTAYGQYEHGEISPTLRRSGGDCGGGSEVLVTDKPCVGCEREWIVRRLTPLECERLQGFPDGWTDIGKWVDTKGKPHKESSDSARYKALGNSIALPPWRYVLRKLSSWCREDKTMGSLFDGIGGFPLIWEEINGKGSCLWASEIEEFAIAVTKRHFGEESGKYEDR